MKASKKEISVWILILLLSITTASLIYLSTAKAIAFDREYYANKFQEFDIDKRFNESVNLTQENKILLDYLQSGKEKGKIESDFFNEKEKIHLEEVLLLFNAMSKTIDLLVLISVVSILAFMYSVQKTLAQQKDQEKYLKKVMARLLTGIGVTVFVIFIFFLIVILTFDSSFITFHEIFFKTDTWMLNPETDNLIRMFPQQFFYDIFTKMIISSLSYGFILLLAGAVIWYWKGKRIKIKEGE